METCGEKIVLNFCFIAKDGKISGVVGAPGDTRGALLLQRDTVMYAQLGAKRKVPDCTTLNIKNSGRRAARHHALPARRWGSTAYGAPNSSAFLRLLPRRQRPASADHAGLRAPSGSEACRPLHPGVPYWLRSPAAASLQLIVQVFNLASQEKRIVRAQQIGSVGK